MTHHALIYQIRVEGNRSPSDVVSALTHAAWQALAAAGGARLDPHRWTDLYAILQEVFRKRLLLYEGCGRLQKCRFSQAVYAAGAGRGLPSGTVYILTLQGGLVRFVEGLADLAWRRFRKDLGNGKKGGRAALVEALHGAMSRYLFYNEACRECHMRAYLPERRIWSPQRAGWAG